MSRAALTTLSQLRTFRALLSSTLVLIAIAVAIGLAALFVPEQVRTLEVFLGAGLVSAAILSGILLFTAYRSLRGDIVRAVTTYEHNLASAHRDALTGAVTRSCFIKDLHQRLRLTDKQPLAYIQIDMDRLKQLNDAELGT